METITASEARANFADMLGRVSYGKVGFTIERRGKPVAHLVPVQATVSIDERMGSLPGVDAGSGGKPLGARRPVHIPPGQKTLSELVVEERR